MCIILDVNCFGDLMNHNNEDMEPVREWIKRRNSNNKIAFSSTDKFKREWSGERKRRLRTWYGKGKIKMVSSQKVESEANRLKGNIKSNDEHIIALAKVSGVNVLVSLDKDLHKDFKKLIKDGKVYQKANHKRLLRNDLCP